MKNKFALMPSLSLSLSPSSYYFSSLDFFNDYKSNHFLCLFISHEFVKESHSFNFLPTNVLLYFFTVFWKNIPFHFYFFRYSLFISSFIRILFTNISIQLFSFFPPYTFNYFFIFFVLVLILFFMIFSDAIE